MCAIEAGKRGRSVAVLEHSGILGRKILISGGGRCNFTNLDPGPESYVSTNPHFAKSALSRFTCGDFIDLVEKHHIRYHEKKLGQLFCNDSAQQIVDLLASECQDVEAKIILNCHVKSIARFEEREEIGKPFHNLAGLDKLADKNFDIPTAGNNPVDDQTRFVIDSSRGRFACETLVIATGGLSVPKIGASGFGYDIAGHFGLDIIPTAPALDGFVFSEEDLRRYDELYGIAIDTVVSVGSVSFRENILFTHKGLSGPASLQASLYWSPGQKLTIDLSPDNDLENELIALRKAGGKKNVKNIAANWMPARFAQRLCQILEIDEPIAEMSNERIKTLTKIIKTFQIEPVSTVGYVKAEVTRGGINTAELSSKTMATKKIPGLYFIGEVMDVTGRLGGYNFQWAWSSGYAAGQDV